MRVVGERIPRYDGMRHVTGKTTYVDDVSLPGILAVKVLRSPVHSALIRSIDVSSAESMPGVAAVITAKDVPNNGFGLVPDEPVLAAHEVRYQGEPIAAVAAVDEDTALEAVSRIKVQFEERRPVFDVMEAMKPDAPQVRPEGNLFQFGGRPLALIDLGDIEKGMREADVVVEGTYTTPMMEHAQLEPQVSLATVENDGKLTIYTVSQAMFFHQGQLASILNVPQSKIKFVGGTVGGGFGAKNDIQSDHITALLALKTSKPVKWRWTREEEFLFSSCRGFWRMEFIDGVKRDGTILARKVLTYRDAGAYSRLNPYVVNKHTFLVSGPYRIPNVHVEGYCVYTNKTPSSSMRGFGLCTGSFGHEVQMEKIARTLGIDSWEIRLKNAHKNGDITATRRAVQSAASIETIQAAARSCGVQLPGHLLAMDSGPREVQS